MSRPAAHSVLSLTPEETVLFACARVELDETNRLLVQEALRAKIDWIRFLEATRFHELEPLAYRHLSRFDGEGCPTSVLDSLKIAAQRISIRNLGLTAELSSLISLLRSEGVQTAALKGPVAAVAYYGNLGLRSFVDIDVLVPRGKAPLAWELLSRQGYGARFSLRPGWQAVQVRRGSEELFRHRDTGNLVDLHWDIWAPGYTFTPESAGIWAAREVVSLGATKVETLAPEAMVLFFCLHGAKHSWTSLKWVCDLAELVRSRPNLDWTAVLRWSDPPGRRLLVDLGLNLVHRLLEAPVPASVLARGSANARVSALVEEAIRGIVGFDNPLPPLWSEIWNALYRRSMECLSDRLRYFHDAFLAPTPHEWMLLPLPPTFAPFYYGVRPLRLAWKHRPWQERK